MNDKQRYYASLERQRSAETSLRSSSSTFQENNALEELYADMGMRAFAAFQNCLDWLGSIGGKRSAQMSAGAGDQVMDKAVVDTLGEMADTLLTLKEQMSRLETAVANLEAGMRRIDKYTLDAFRQLAELDAARVMEAQRETPEVQPSRRLAKDDAVRLAVEAAERMAKAGQTLSLAAVAREAGLKYGQIVYAFGNKENFLAKLTAISAAHSGEDRKSRVQTEVAATGDTEAVS